MMYRLAPVPGEWLDRSNTLSFTFEGETHVGYAGDTLTSALAAAGVMVFGRSFKYHRPRGLASFANHDVNALFQVGDEPNVRGDVTPLAADLQIAAVNTQGGLQHDRRRHLDRLARFLPVGFYYKAFHSKRWFPHWERLFRALTGLGEVSFDAPRIRTPKAYAFCDVLVIGAGPSGLAAALAAAEAGARVMLIEEAARPGGSGLWGNAHAPARREQLQQLLAAVLRHPAIELRCAAYAAGYYADHWIAVVERERLSKLRARAVIVATGVLEQPAVFRNNDLPGVLLASGAQRLLARHAVAPGRRVVIVGANLEAYEACLDLLAHGVDVAALVDLRFAGEPDPIAGLVRGRGVRIQAGWRPHEAVADADGLLTALVIARASDDSPAAFATERLDCDALLLSVGWAPAGQLLHQAGAIFEFDTRLQQYLPVSLPPGVFAAGRVNGVFELLDRIRDGRRAGVTAAASLGFTIAAPEPSIPVTRQPSHPYPIFPHAAGKNFVDFDEDLQLADLQNAVQEGFDSSELLKRYSTVGMGPSQGKHSNMNAARILARLLEQDVAQVGMTTTRPFYHPVPMKLLAGRGLHPERATPLVERHRQAGAVWMPAGNWWRPEYYAVSGRLRQQCIAEEVQAVRTAVGLIDVGTLGKIDIFGPAAGEFLDRVYAGRYSDLKVGMTRYGLMLDEAGTIVDDGVIARLAPEHYYFTTTTGNSASVYRELLRLNALWGLDCALANVTGHRAAFNLAGPSSRRLLQALTAADLSDAAFPYLGVREANVDGVAARLLRVGFVGELGYEIHVADGEAVRVWDALQAAGGVYGLRLFGVEAQRLLRLEKAHFIIGQDTDGLTNPLEAGALWAVKMTKPFFIGQRSLKVLMAREQRQQLVGFELPPGPLPLECQLVIAAGEIAGRVTSVARSEALGRTIGLAMVRPALSSPGSELQIRIDDGSLITATVVKTPFYDPAQLRQKPVTA